MDDTEIREALQRYNFYHVIQLTDAIQTPGWSDPYVLRTQAMVLSTLGSLDLKGKRVLDIGCRDGLFSFAAERQGAGEVIGIDNDLSQGATEFLIPYFKSRVRMHQLNIYDLTPSEFGAFDVVICAGVLYHLRFPFWGLKRIRDVITTGGQLVLETAIWVDENQEALLFCPVGSESPYEPTSCTFFNIKGLTDTLGSLGFRVQQILCLDDHQRRLAKPWPTFRRRLGLLLGRPKSQIIDRAIFTCQRGPVDPAVVNAEVQEYWYGTHQIHRTWG